MSERPGVSILVLNLNGREHLERCFASVAALDYPRGRLEVLFLDNGSSDDSVAYMRANHPDVRIVEFGQNLGYAVAMNRGVKEASHELLVFLNNDTTVEPDLVDQLIRPIEEGRAACTGAKIMSWDGSRVGFAGGGTNFHGIAFQHGLDEPDGPEYGQAGRTLFGCGAAMAIPRSIFLDVGAFDEDFFAYYEDVDLGWRLWVLGYEVLYVPQAVVRHHHSATSLRIALHKIRVLHMRNPLLMIFKNYEIESLRRVLPAALLLSSRRTWFLSGVDPTDFRIGDDVGEPRKRGGLLRRGRSREEYEAEMSIHKLAVSDLVAVNDIVGLSPSVLEKRRWIQEHRKRADREIAPLFLDPFRSAEANPEYVQFQQEICSLFGIDELFADLLRVSS